LDEARHRHLRALRVAEPRPREPLGLDAIDQDPARCPVPAHVSANPGRPRSGHERVDALAAEASPRPISRWSVKRMPERSWPEAHGRKFMARSSWPEAHGQIALAKAHGQKVHGRKLMAEAHGLSRPGGSLYKRAACKSIFPSPSCRSMSFCWPASAWRSA